MSVLGTAGERWLVQLRSAYRQELQFYRQYHRHEVNWRMHAVLVPLEWTAWLMLCSLVRLHWPLALAAAAYYLLLDSKLSCAAAAAQVLFALAADRTLASLGSYGAATLAVSLQAISWTLQVGVGHWLIEKNNPAMASGLTWNAVALSTLMAWDFATQ
jgi:uncharacterized membrane protein YGL010W